MIEILCHECRHDIDYHALSFPRGCEDGEGCRCSLVPSDIARALLTAEPTEAGVEAAAQELHHFHGINAWHILTEPSRDKWREKTRAILRAARQARR